MKLYFARTLHSYKACAVARHLELPVDFIEVDMLGGAHKSAEFLRMNPGGRVPVLFDGKMYIWEANAIMCRLAIAAGSDLWPDGTAQADVMRWLSWDSEHFKPYAGVFYFEQLIKPNIGLGKPDKAAIDAATGPFRAAAQILDNHLADREFLLGNMLTIADFAVAVTLPFANQTYMPMDGFPAVNRWHSRLMELPAWSKPFR